jgi:hypothetical protein
MQDRAKAFGYLGIISSKLTHINPEINPKTSPGEIRLGGHRIAETAQYVGNKALTSCLDTKKACIKQA